MHPSQLESGGVFRCQGAVPTIFAPAFGLRLTTLLATEYGAPDRAVFMSPSDIQEIQHVR